MEFRADGNAKPLGLRFLIYGRTGCIGGLLGRICEAQGIPFAYGSGRLEDRESLRADIVAVQPSHVFNAAGATGRPNVEDLIKNYENVCILRVKIHLLSDLSHHRNFIKKIINFERVINILNSMTVLDELLPISIEMAKRNFTGVWNFTNPDVLSHNEILEIYRDYIDSNFTWKNFTLEEQAKVLAAPRCNNELDSTKLKQEFPKILPIKESAIKYVFEPNKKKINLA
ncbi:hypothetical protein QUC31_008846 [Theobroma cacao]